MRNKNSIPVIERELRQKKFKFIALLAPSFITTFEYPSIIVQLKKLGFDKVVELTFGAKMINRCYHNILEKKKGLVISSACPGIVKIINKHFPEYRDNIIKVNSPMIATAKICKKIYPVHKTCFISPCEFKKNEAEKSDYVDYVIDYEQLSEMFDRHDIKESNEKNVFFDKFYNDYTKIYPLSGGLSKTAHFKGVLKKGEEKIIDGIEEVERFLENPDENIRFLDATFCKGGCIGGPYTARVSLEEKRKRLMHYLEIAKEEKSPKQRKGIVEKAKGIKFTR